MIFSESDREEKADDKENMELVIDSNKSSQENNCENSEEPKKKRGWPKGVPRGSPLVRKNSPRGRPSKVRIIIISV